jgi:hypothetical protein
VRKVSTLGASPAYREGDIERAVRWSEKSHEYRDGPAQSAALALVVQAMAQHQLEETDQARQSLADATALIPFNLSREGYLPPSRNPDAYTDWLIAEVLRREAAFLIHKDASRSEMSRQEQWTRVTKAALADVDAHPEDRFTWLRAAPRLILSGDVKAYRQLCRRMIEQFHGTTSVNDADMLCKICLLLPGAADRANLPSALLVDWLEKASAPHPWFYACLALAAYREGDFQHAVRYSGKSHQCRDRPAQSAALALVVQAMAQHQLEQTDQARQSLADATALIPYELGKVGSAGFADQLPLSSDDADWLVAEILRREAALLIHKDARRPEDALDSTQFKGDPKATK